MPFQPGQVTNPGGKPKQKPFSDALRLALFEPETAPDRKRTKLDKVVAALLEKATGGDVPALKEVADRIEGKVPQAIVGDDDHPGLMDPIAAMLAQIDGKTRSV